MQKMAFQLINSHYHDNYHLHWQDTQTTWLAMSFFQWLIIYDKIRHKTQHSQHTTEHLFIYVHCVSKKVHTGGLL